MTRSFDAGVDPRDRSDAPTSTRRTGRIGVIATGSPLYGPAAMLAGLEAAIRAQGCATSVVLAVSRAEVQAAVERLEAEGVDALVIAQQPAEVDALDLARRMPVLSLTDVPDPRLVVVSADQRGGGRVATDHLLALGHRSVHHISGPADSQHSSLRTRGWRDAVVAAGATATGAARTGDWGAGSGRTAMRAVLDADPTATAVFAANDQMAIGAMRAVRDAGLRVPADVSVVGFDDAPESAHLSPALTTVRQDFAAVTRRGVAALLAALDGDPGGERRRLVPLEIVVRESTAAPNPARLR